MKYENNYIENLNRRLQDAETRLAIMKEYVTHYKEVGHYHPEEGVMFMILGVHPEKDPEVPVAK